jgi:SagB-type dehydrogenase family enzyme
MSVAPSGDARAYHAATVHTPESIRRGDHTLDWETKPEPFKIYADVPPLSLPRDLPALTVDAFEALGAAVDGPAPLDLDRLAGLLFFAAGVTKHRRYPGGGEVYFRAAPSTGALYQTEVYVVAGAVVGLDPGVYHFCPGDFSLRRLREGDFRGALAGAAADEGVGRSPATLVLTGIYWRNTWKYRARGYRHLFWDAGAMLAHALPAAAGLGLPARAVTAFVEVDVHGLLGLDPAREGALALLPVGAEGADAPVSPVVTTLAHRVLPLSPREVDEPLLRAAYYVSSLDAELEVTTWREAVVPPPVPPAGPVTPLPAPAPRAGRALGDTIVRRGSTRRFSGEAIGLDALSAALFHATRAVPWDAPASLVETWLTVHAVEGLAPGAYAYDPGRHALIGVRAGDVRGASAFLCLEQALGGGGSATVFFLADLDRVLGPLGDRGYRAANLEAGLIGGRLYLGAYAQGFGATGLTFYDDEVVRFFAPAAAGRTALFVTALGRAATGPASPLIPPVSLSPPGRG